MKNAARIKTKLISSMIELIYEPLTGFEPTTSAYNSAYTGKQRARPLRHSGSTTLDNSIEY